MAHHEGKLEPPVIGDLRMPKKLWWMCLVAAEVTGCDPLLLAAVMRFESDFRCGPIGYGTYAGPMGIRIDAFRKKYPIHDVFGNILTGARRLAQFTDNMNALRGYNKDRSPKFGGYCRSVLRAIREMQDEPKPHLDGWPWRSAVDLGRRGLVDLELKAAAYACRRN